MRREGTTDEKGKAAAKNKKEKRFGFLKNKKWSKRSWHVTKGMKCKEKVESLNMENWKMLSMLDYKLCNP